jgi:hypothetical protein
VQFSLFGTEAATPALGDLDALLLAGAEWVRSGNTGHAADRSARLSVLVDGAWRARALREEFELRGLHGEVVEAPGDLLAVRTGFTPALSDQAERWIRGATFRVPDDLALTAWGLRLWAIATGRVEEAGYLLGTGTGVGERAANGAGGFAGPTDELRQRVAGAELARLGIPAVEVAVRSRRGWRITSAKRLRRLAELVGPGPLGCESDWPMPT